MMLISQLHNREYEKEKKKSGGSHEYNTSLCSSHYFCQIIYTPHQIKEHHEPFNQPLGGS